jgi:hypothetical protein
VKKPVKFMGEEVGGGFDEMEGDEVVIDEEDAFHLEDGEDGDTADEDGRQMIPSSQKQQRRKRKISDWVVQSFANRHFPSLKSDRGDASNQQPSSSIWKSVQKDAILNAAWTSRQSEKSIWANDNRSSVEDTLPTSRPISTTKSSQSSSASKMFQSVMTRVGSNGRILGAYPMDAPPIEECCESEDVDDDSWGGGDLFLDGLDNDDQEDSQLFNGEGKKSVKSKSRRKKISASNNNGGELSLMQNKIKRRRKRTKSQQI